MSASDKRISGRLPQSQQSSTDIKNELDESNASTPKPSNNGDGTSVPPDDASKKINGGKAGTKRQSTAQDGSKPGPKKKARITDGANTNSTPTIKKSGNTAATGAGLKGPRANTGAINAGLRALDRSGKPCRRWEKKGVALKSFTGIHWSVGTWNAPRTDISSFPGDVKSDASSSAGPDLPIQRTTSDSSNTGDSARTPAIQMNGLASSPAPVLA